MLELGLVFALMCVVAVLIVIIPVLQVRHEVGVERTVVNARIFQERLTELETDLKEKRIDGDEFNQLRLELQKTLLADVDPRAQTGKSGAAVVSGKLPVVIALAMIIPSLTATYYWQRGRSNDVAEWLSLQQKMNFIVDKALTGAAPTAAETKDVTVADFIRILQLKLQQDSQNPIGWMLLGVSYLQVEMPVEAQDSLQHAYELAPENPEIQVGYAQAMIGANEGKLTAQASMILQQLLANHPDHPQALMVFGMASFNSGEYQNAIDVWQKLLSIRDDDSEGAQIIRRSIDLAKQRIANPAPVVAEANGASVRVTVNIDPLLQAKLQPTDMLFVFAKAASGPPMPLAVHRQTVGGFPLTVELNDAKAMSEALKLSKFPNVIVSARISHSGQAIGQPGDFQGASGVIDVAAQKEPVVITIQDEIK